MRGLYANGLSLPNSAASNWSAERMIAGYPEFDYFPEIKEPFYFTGEMVSVGEDSQDTDSPSH